MKLYSHQKEAVANIQKAFTIHNRVLAVLATGSGKTIIYLDLANQWSNSGLRVLILAHRRELIHQPIDRAKQFYPQLSKRIGVVMANIDKPKSQVVVATIQTASKDKGRLEAMGQFDYVILDECHHGTASTYMKLVEHFKSAKWLGLTATPFRNDGSSLARLFDTVAYRLPITTAIDKGILVPFDALGFTLPVVLSNLEETTDGWNDEDLGTLLSAPNALEIVYEKWKKYCSDRSTICFTSSVSQAHITAGYFENHGAKAVAVDGSTPKGLRDEILERFRNGEIQVVANCQVWTEGVDVPEASAALMVCPTKSDLAYTQKLGRILRTAPGKKNAVVLDFSPMEDRNIIMAGDILGVPRIVEKAEARARKSGILVSASSVNEYGIAVSVDPADILVEALKYLRKGQLAWALKDYLAVATLSDYATLAIEIPNVIRIAKAEELKHTKQWNAQLQKVYQSILLHRVWICLKSGPSQSWGAQYLGSFKTMEDALIEGEKMMDTYYIPALGRKRGQWRSKLASEKQLKYMWQLDIKPPEGCTSGQAAQLISSKLASKTVNNARKRLELEIGYGKRT